MGNADTNNQNLNKRVKLYLRFPRRIETQEEVKQLYSGIASVFLPRQKSCCWCIITLKSSKNFKEARSTLRKTKVDNNRIVVTPLLHRNKERSTRVARMKAEKRAVQKEARKAQSKSLLVTQAGNKKAVNPTIKTDSLIDLLNSE